MAGNRLFKSTVGAANMDHWVGLPWSWSADPRPVSLSEVLEGSRGDRGLWTDRAAGGASIHPASSSTQLEQFNSIFDLKKM